MFNLAWDDPANPNDGNKREAFLYWAKRQGYNMLSITNHYSNSNGTNGVALWPLNASEYAEAEAILNDLAEKGFLVHPFAGFFGKDRPYPTNAADQIRYIKYTLARFGPYWNVLLNVAGPEPNNGDWMSSEDVSRLGTEIKKHDVFGHLLGVHNRDGDDPYQASTWSSYVTLQHEITSLEEYGAYLRKAHTGSKPVYAHETLWVGNTLQPSWTLTDLRKYMWVTLMSAAAYNAGDMTSNSSSGFSGSMELADKIQDRHDIPKVIWDFFETVPFYRMTPCPELVSAGYCLAEVGQEYLVYLDTTQSVNVQVANGPYHVDYINAQDPTKKEPGSQTINGQNLTPPSGGDDWVVHLYKGR
jgi:hypothetical protein